MPRGCTWPLVLLAGTLAMGCTAARPVGGERGPPHVHASGILDAASPDFHGKLLESRSWNFGFCAQCHGQDFAGGASGVTCLTCHTDGPTSCTTCHGMPPVTGAHLAHAGSGVLQKNLDCSECHIKPGAWSDVGHLLDASGNALPRGAPVVFGAFAQTPSPLRDGDPTYVGGTCANVYCHAEQKPTWAPLPPAMCGSCHGPLPAAPHPQNVACQTCHERVVDGALAWKDESLHLDGRVSLGDDSGTCLACHSQLGGAHAQHTGAAHELARPIACTECHKVPAQVNDPGHLTDDGRAAVFPSGGTGAIAGANDAAPHFDQQSGSCGDVHCHGGGTKLSADTALGIDRAPNWISGAGNAPVCGSCHGIPPHDGLHDVTWKLETCNGCHPKSIDATGSILVEHHADGVIDVQ